MFIHTYIHTYIYVYINTFLFMYTFPNGYVCIYIHGSQYFAVRELVSCVSPTGEHNGDNNFLSVVYHENYTTSAVSSKVHISIHTYTLTSYI